jgi:predicted GNAT superfamily acetyltransferase
LDSIVVKPIDNKEDYLVCEEIQQELSPLNEVGIVPAYLMELVAENGGLLLGIYVGGKIVGFNFSLPAYNQKDGYYLFSDTSGLYSAYQKKSLGFLLKQEQYRIALQRKIKKIVWTYDPLLGVNANLNVRKLGGIIRRYYIEAYNELPISTGVSIPADRFYLEWPIKSERVKKRVEELKIPQIKIRERLYFPQANKTIRILYSLTSGGTKRALLFREIIDLELNLKSDAIAVEIPYDYREMRKELPFLARDWRLKTREIFSKYINELGYAVSEFFQVEEYDEIRNFYLLRRRNKQSEESKSSEFLF